MDFAKRFREREFLLQLWEIPHESSSHDWQIEGDEMLVRGHDSKQVQFVAEEGFVVSGLELVHVIVDHAENEACWLKDIVEEHINVRRNLSF